MKTLVLALLLAVAVSGQEKTQVKCVAGFNNADLLVMCGEKGDFFTKVLDKDTVHQIAEESKNIEDAKLWLIADNMMFFKPEQKLNLQTFAAQIQAVLNKCAVKYDFTVSLPAKK